MAYELTGRVKVIQEAQVFGSGFTKREFVVTVEDGQYPQYINLETVQEKVSFLDDVRIGDEVKATFDIRGREYQNRYFNNLQCWRLDVLSKGSEAPEPPSDGEQFGDDQDQIPF